MDFDGARLVINCAAVRSSIVLLLKKDIQLKWLSEIVLSIFYYSNSILIS